MTCNRFKDTNNRVNFICYITHHKIHLQCHTAICGTEELSKWVVFEVHRCTSRDVKNLLTVNIRSYPTISMKVKTFPCTFNNSVILLWVHNNSWVTLRVIANLRVEHEICAALRSKTIAVVNWDQQRLLTSTFWHEVYLTIFCLSPNTQIRVQCLNLCVISIKLNGGSKAICSSRWHNAGNAEIFSYVRGWKLLAIVSQIEYYAYRLTMITKSAISFYTWTKNSIIHQLSLCVVVSLCNDVLKEQVRFNKISLSVRRIYHHVLVIADITD